MQANISLLPYWKNANQRHYCHSDVDLGKATTWLNQESLFNVVCFWEIARLAEMFSSKHALLMCHQNMAQTFKDENTISKTFRFSFIKVITLSL